MMNDDGGGENETPAVRRRKQRGPREYKPREPRPIDAAQLQDLAVGYAAKYATTAAKLRRYLARKLGERIWTGDTPPDVETLVSKITSLGYVDDRAYAASKARDLTTRGFGARRVRGALSAAGVSSDDVSATIDADPDEDAAAIALTTAIAFARRRRFGPFARDGASTDPVRMRRELAAMARAGHDFGVAKRVLRAGDVDAIDGLMDD